MIWHIYKFYKRSQVSSSTLCDVHSGAAVTCWRHRFIRCWCRHSHSRLNDVDSPWLLLETSHVDFSWSIVGRFRNIFDPTVLCYFPWYHSQGLSGQCGLHQISLQLLQDNFSICMRGYFLTSRLHLVRDLRTQPLWFRLNSLCSLCWMIPCLSHPFTLANYWAETQHRSKSNIH